MVYLLQIFRLSVVLSMKYRSIFTLLYTVCCVASANFVGKGYAMGLSVCQCQSGYKQDVTYTTYMDFSGYH